MADGDVSVTDTNNRALGCNYFNGTSDYIDIPHNGAELGANLPNGFTLSAWIFPESLGEGNLGRIMDKSTNTGGDGGFYWRLLTDTKLQFRLNAGTAADSGNIANLFKIWSHVLVTISATQRCTFYINGVQTGVANINLVQGISAITTTTKMRIGNVAGGTNYTFDGGIREVKMWNRVLTQTEITADYNNIVSTNGLLHHYKLAGDYTDYGSIGSTATNSGSTIAILEDNIAKAIKAQRTSADDKYMLFGKKGTSVGCVQISE